MSFLRVCVYVFKALDLSNNYLDNLPAGLFRDLSNLTRLTLHNNSLTVMDRELFQVGPHGSQTECTAQSLSMLNIFQYSRLCRASRLISTAGS